MDLTKTREPEEEKRTSSLIRRKKQKVKERERAVENIQ